MELKFNIFISHDSKDETIAVELKAFLENIFLNASVYVSGRDLMGGQTWIENIKLSLSTSQVIISIITKESLNNNWIYFETGSGFTDDKSIPLIADGLKFKDIKPPLSLLQSRILSNKGIKLLVNDISGKLNQRSPKMLTGIDKLLNESESFFKLRNQEVLEKPMVEVKSSKKLIEKTPISREVDPELEQQVNYTNERALNLTRNKILTFGNKYDIPTKEELDEFDLSDLQQVTNAFNIPYPAGAFTDLLMLGFNPLPSRDAKQWEKLNVTKRLDSANSILDKFELTI